MSRVAITRQKLDELALHVSAKSGEAMPLTIDGMMDAVDDIDLDDKFIVTISYTTDQGWTGQDVHFIPDCTFAELEAAYSAGKEIAFRIDQSKTGWYSNAYADYHIEDHTEYITVWYIVGGTEYNPERYDGRTGDSSICLDNIVYGWTQGNGEYEGIFKFGGSTGITPYGTFNVTTTNIGNGTVSLPSYHQCSIPILTLPTTTASSRTTGSLFATISPSTSVRYLNIPYGFNKTQGSYALAAMPTGTAGTPTATKGTVSNHSVSVTPSVTNTTGYITGGTKTGTAVTVSASELVSGSETKTANGTYDVTNLAELVVNVSGGGGLTNVVMGTFTTGSTRNSNQSITIPYTGSGYPIALMVFIAGGVYNNGTGGNTTWYNSLDRYDVGAFYMTKARTTTAPTYGTSGADNYGAIVYIYKNSTSQSTSYSRGSSMTANTFTSSSTSAASGNNCCRFKGNGKTLSVYIGNKTSSTYGFPPSTDLQYIVVYSS